MMAQSLVGFAWVEEPFDQVARIRAESDRIFTISFRRNQSASYPRSANNSVLNLSFAVRSQKC
jgi:hypothetical protein